jgi:hypothetical protein
MWALASLRLQPSSSWMNAWCRACDMQWHLFKPQVGLPETHLAASSAPLFQQISLKCLNAKAAHCEVRS